MAWLPLLTFWNHEYNKMELKALVVAKIPVPLSLLHSSSAHADAGRDLLGE